MREDSVNPTTDGTEFRYGGFLNADSARIHRLSTRLMFA